MKITRLEIRNYRGIRDMSIAVAPGGAVVRGKNAAGKTSVLKAIRAALLAQDAGPDAIRLGEESGEIIVNLDAIKVRRTISGHGTSVSVENADGDRWGKPQTRLNELFGTVALDPLAFYLEEDKKRRALVLEAVPLRVTEEDLERWGIPVDMRPNLAQHGLLVIEELRKGYYAQRTTANRDEATAEADVKRCRVVLDGMPKIDSAEKSPAAAGADLAAAERALRALEAQRQAAAMAAAATDGTRKKIAELGKRAAETRFTMPDDIIGDARLAAVARRTAAAANVERLESDLEKARAEHATADAIVAEQDHVFLVRDMGRLRAEDYERQAAELEESLRGMDSLVVSGDEYAAASLAVDTARAAVAKTDAVAAVLNAQQTLQAAVDVRDAAAKKAKRLDGIVKALTAAPTEIAARAEGIKGVGFDDGGGVTLDGVSIDALSGAEQMQFAIDLARRANAQAKILVVDGLERLDAERFAAFVKYATREDWQLIATRVDAGELVVEAIEVEQ